MQPGHNCSRCSQCLFILKAYSIKDPHLELRAKWKAHDWRGHGLSGDAATTALLHRWNLLGKHLLTTSVDTCRLLLQPSSASHKTTSQMTAAQASCSMLSHRWRKPIQGLHQPLQDSREMLKGRQKERKSWMKGCRVV